MIKFIVHQLTPEGIVFDGEEPVAILEIADTPELSFPTPIHYRLKASLVSSGVLVEGETWTGIAAQCGRCLEMFETEIRATDICHFYENVSEPELDVTEDIREDLLLAVPPNPICDEDCLGLCLKCGGNRNLKPCKCHEKKPGNPAWGDLDNLKFEK